MNPEVWNAAQRFIDAKCSVRLAQDSLCDAKENLQASKEALKSAIGLLGPEETIVLSLSDDHSLVCQSNDDYEVFFSTAITHTIPEDFSNKTTEDY